MPYSTYLLISANWKTSLQPNWIRLTTANNTELISEVSVLITLKLGERNYIDTFIVLEQLSATFLTGFLPCCLIQSRIILGLRRKRIP